MDKLSEDGLAVLLRTAYAMLENSLITTKPACTYCGSESIIRYGKKHGKQRFLCKSCGHTFVQTTHTIMSNSHFPKEMWEETISDAILGHALDYTAKRIGFSRQTAFHMRQKILMALRELPDVKDILLGSVSEFDETFVLDCYKGKTLFDIANRGPANMMQRHKKEGSPANICVFALVSSAREMLLPLPSTRQNPMRGSCCAYMKDISPMEPLRSVMV